MNIHTDHREDFTVNYTALKRCRSIYNKLFIGYMFLLAVFPLVSVFIAVGTVISNDSIFLMLDSIVMTPLLYFCAYKAVYHKRDLAAVAIPAIFLVNQLILGISRHHLSGKFINGLWVFKAVSYVFWIHLILLCIAAVFSFFNMQANVKYHWLEEQPGFPHFNERFENQLEDQKQTSILDEYTMNYQQRMKTASSEMQDIELPVITEKEDSNDPQ